MALNGNSLAIQWLGLQDSTAGGPSFHSWAISTAISNHDENICFIS